MSKLFSYRITSDSNISWNLFTNNIDNNGQNVAQVLGAVRGIFIDVFGPDTVNAHPTLAVVPSFGNPVTYRENCLIFLSSTGSFYLQHIYQFAHELCHFMVPHEVCAPYRWLEETLCAAMSWYALRRIYEARKVNPVPILNSLYHGFETYIANAQERRIDLNGVPLSMFLTQHFPDLCKDCYDRSTNAAIAYEIYPLFEAHPDLWKIVPHLHELNGGMDLSEAISRLLISASVEKTGGDQLRQRLCE